MLEKLLTTVDRIHINKKILAWVVLGVFLFSLLPLFSLSFFARPHSDDYFYGEKAAKALRQHEGIGGMLKGAAAETKHMYNNWQGTFAAIFLMSLQPGIWGEQYYFLSTFILLSALVLSTFFFLHTVIVRKMKGDWATWVIVSSLISFLSVHSTPHASEVFFWFNGAVFYTFFHAVFLVMLSLLLRAEDIKALPAQIAVMVLVSILAFLIGGSNYVTALSACVVCGLVGGFYIYKHNKNWWMYLVAFGLTLVGLAISALSPGTAVRAAALKNSGTVRLSAIATVFQSLVQGVKMAGRWTTVHTLAAVGLSMPVLWPLVKKSRLAFKHPLLVGLGLLVLFSAQMAPPVMMKVFGSVRHLAIMYDVYLLLLFTYGFYLLGWGRRYVLANRDKLEWLRFLQGRDYHRILILGMVFIALIGFVGLSESNYTGKAAMNDLLSGRATAFAKVRDERLAIYLDPTVKDAVVPPLTARPSLFLETDLWYRDWWVNDAVAGYYGKDSVSLIGGE